VNNILLPKSLPNLPASIMKIQEMFASNNIDNMKLTILLQEDPLLCANILKLVNSPYYGLSTKVTSIQHAVMLLGSTIIRGITMAVMLKKSFPIDLSPYKITIEQFDKISTLRVQFLKYWVKDIDIQTLSSVAFLLEAGKIVTSHAIVKNNLLNEFTKLLKNHTILEAEKSLFGIHNYEVSAMLFEKWGFDKNFTDLIVATINPKVKDEKILHIVYTLIGINGIITDETLQDSLKMVQEYKFDVEIFKNSVNKIKSYL
jgi:HD-like signal output (HDOD) protein